jgi:Holliday junction resolvase RusA-like endonuclease
MEHVGEPPWMDLDNLAKALLDAIKGYLFHDDAQVARLLVERREGERERITIRAFPRQASGGPG